MSYLMRRDPFRGLVRMQEEMDRLFQSLFGASAPETVRESVGVPAVDTRGRGLARRVLARCGGMGGE